MDCVDRMHGIGQLYCEFVTYMECVALDVGIEKSMHASQTNLQVVSDHVMIVVLQRYPNCSHIGTSKTPLRRLLLHN